MRRTALEHRIETIVTPAAADMGLRLHCVKIIGEGGSRVVQVMAEDPVTHNIGIDQCAALSRSVSALLDVEDPIEGAYRLEVSSPGIDRLLLRPEDFTAYTGHEAKIETEIPLENGQRRFKGVMHGLEGDSLKITTEQGDALIPLGIITKSKLVLTDRLIRETSARSSSISPTERKAKD